MKTICELGAEPGKGKGNGYPVRKAGGTDTCVCPKCGETVEHTRGTPCNQLKCPKCGAAMQGSTGTQD